jgi:large subunit ribosomal protein L9
VNVILLQDVPGLGKRGEVARVADGHARNYLLPRGLAQEATAGRMKDIDRQKEAAREKEKRAAAAAAGLAERLAGLTVHIKARTGEKGKLFGSVGNQDVSEALQAEHGLQVDKKKIVLKEPIRSLGEYKAVIRLHHAVSTEVTVEVTKG